MDEEQLKKHLTDLDQKLDEAKESKEESNKYTNNSMGEIGFPIKWPKDPTVTVANLDEIPTPPNEIKVTNLDEITTPEFPEDIRVSNLDEIQIPQPKPFPESIGIKKPAWLPLAFVPLKPIKEVLDEINEKLGRPQKEIKFPLEDKEAVPVRIINHQPQFIQGGGGGGSTPTVKTSSGERAVPVVNPDGTNISGGSGSGDGTIIDGVTATIKATVFDLANSNPLVTQIVDANGDAIVSFGGGTQYAVDDALGSIPTGTLALAIRDDATAILTPIEGDAVGLRVNSRGALWVDLETRLDATNDTVTANLSATDNAVLDAIAAKDFATQTTLAALNAKLVTGTDIGDVTINNSTGAAAVNVQDGGNTLTVDGTVAVTNGGTFVTQVDGAALTALQLIDNLAVAVDGNYLNVNANIAGTDMVSGSGTATGALRVELPTNGTGVVGLNAGTNAIGKLAANSGVDIGDVDVTSVPRSLSGPGQPGTAVDSYTHAAFNLAAGANQVLVSSAANKQIWVYGIGFTVNVAGTVSFQDEDDTAITGIMQMGVTGGMTVAPSGNFSMPIWKLATDKDLEVDVVTSELDGWIDYAIISV